MFKTYMRIRGFEQGLEQIIGTTDGVHINPQARVVVSEIPEKISAGRRESCNVVLGPDGTHTMAPIAR